MADAFAPLLSRAAWYLVVAESSQGVNASLDIPTEVVLQRRDLIERLAHGRLGNGINRI